MNHWHTGIQHYCSGKCGITNCLRNYQEQYKINRNIKGIPSNNWEEVCPWNLDNINQGVQDIIEEQQEIKDDSRIQSISKNI